VAECAVLLRNLSRGTDEGHTNVSQERRCSGQKSSASQKRLGLSQIARRNDVRSRNQIVKRVEIRTWDGTPHTIQWALVRLEPVVVTCIKIRPIQERRLDLKLHRQLLYAFCLLTIYDSLPHHFQSIIHRLFIIHHHTL
jgi:hypothetical protein